MSKNCRTCGEEMYLNDAWAEKTEDEFGDPVTLMHPPLWECDCGYKEKFVEEPKAGQP